MSYKTCVLLITLLLVSDLGWSKLHQCQIRCEEEVESYPISLPGKLLGTADEKEPRVMKGEKGEPGPPGKSCDCAAGIPMRSPRPGPKPQPSPSYYEDILVKYNELLIRVQQLEPHRSCAGIKAGDPEAEDGVYMIHPYKDTNVGFTVYCDMTTDGGGWMVVQKRFDGSVNFRRSWADYEKGFGDKSGEHWLGLKHLHKLTKLFNMEARIDMTDFKERSKHAKYENFSVGPSDGYELSFDGYSGNAGDSLGYQEHHQGIKFSTYDHDQDKSDGSCADRWDGGWWFNKCFKTNLNGQRLKKDEKNSKWEGIIWVTFVTELTNPIKATEIKLREK